MVTGEVEIASWMVESLDINHLSSIIHHPSSIIIIIIIIIIILPFVAKGELWLCLFLHYLIDQPERKRETLEKLLPPSRSRSSFWPPLVPWMTTSWPLSWARWGFGWTAGLEGMLEGHPCCHWGNSSGSRVWEVKNYRISLQNFSASSDSRGW